MSAHSLAHVPLQFGIADLTEKHLYIVLRSAALHLVSVPFTHVVVFLSGKAHLLGVSPVSLLLNDGEAPHCFHPLEALVQVQAISLVVAVDQLRDPREQRGRLDFLEDR
jgi:hypothetical protein